jgi:ABC-type antimicrobial peptide transport system permease subunit
VVNEAFARTYWPDASSVLGRTIKQGTREEEGPTHVVVGVVGDVLQDPALPPEPQIYLSFDQQNVSGSALVVRAGENTADVMQTLRNLIRRMDSVGLVTRLTTLRDMEAELLIAPRFYAVLIGGFGTLALLIALIGVYGTTAYQTRGRAREIGIRLALGAESGGVVRQIVASTLVVSLGGVAAGVLVGLGATRVLSRFLFDLEPTDPATFVAVGVLVTVASALAAYLPARRAAAVDPGLTLRAEG